MNKFLIGILAVTSAALGQTDVPTYRDDVPRHMLETQIFSPRTPTRNSEKSESFFDSRYLRLHSIGSGLRSGYEGVCTFFTNTKVQQLLQTAFQSQFFTTCSQSIGDLAGRLKVLDRLQYVRGLSILGFLYVPRVIKCTKKFMKARGYNRINQLMKVTQAISIILDSMVKTAIGAEAFKFSAKLGTMGYPLAEATIKNIVKYAFPLGALSWALSWATLEIDFHSLRRAQRVYLGANNAGELNVSMTVQALSIGEKGRIEKKKQWLEKSVEVNNIAALVGRLKEANKLSAETQKVHVLILDRLQTIILQKKLTTISDALNFTATPLIVTSFLHPVGYVCLAGYVLLTTFNFFHRQITTYQFENKMGLIERTEDDPLFTGGTWAPYYQVKDFAAWFLRLKTYRTFPD